MCFVGAVPSTGCARRPGCAPSRRGARRGRGRARGCAGPGRSPRRSPMRRGGRLGSLQSGSSSGHVRCCSVGAALGSCCAHSSVTKGMNGCSRRSSTSSVVTAVHTAARRDTGSAASTRRSFTISTYQSQNVCHAVSYRPSTASWNRYASKPGVARAHHRGQLGEHPSILGPQRLRLRRMHIELGHRAVAHPREQEAVRHLPELVGETLVRGDAVLVEAHVLAARRHHRRPRAQRVGPVLVDELERIDGVALRLAHPASRRRAWIVLVISTSVNGFRPVKLEARHDHPGHPEEDDVAPRDQRVGRVEPLEVGGLLGPSEDGERPQPAAEPRVEHVRDRW